MNWHICHKRKLLFLFVFSTYLPLLLLKFWSGDLVGCIIKFHIQRVPARHTFDGPRYPKNKKYLKNMMMMSSSCFSGISCFWDRGVRQKYALWVLVGCRIKFCIQRAFLLEIWVKTQGDMSKIRTKNSFLLWQICQFNHYGWLILLKFYWFLNSNSQNLFLAHFLIRPILDPKFPLM